jgi:hypothetical protein
VPDVDDRPLHPYPGLWPSLGLWPRETITARVETRITCANCLLTWTELKPNPSPFALICPRCGEHA